MKKLISVLVSLLALTPILASTDIWTQLQTGGGYTKYAEMTSVGGYDWSEQSYVMTGNVFDGFENYGTVFMLKGLSTPSAWNMESLQLLSGMGDTLIWKNVDVWSEDSTIDCCTGKLKYPTEAWVEIDFSTPKPFHTANSWYVLLDEPPAEEHHGYFNNYIQTDEVFQYAQKVGINNFPSDYSIPQFPEIPEFHWVGVPS